MQALKVTPVFIKPADIDPSILGEEICRAAEREVGEKGIFALQKAGGLLRLYPQSEAARSRLVLKGFSLRGIRIFPTPTSPKRTFSRDGIVVQSTRLVISNLPISVSDTDILEEIRAAGYKPLSALSYDCLRDKNKRLTRFCNGNRSIFVVQPAGPLPKTVKVQSKFTAFIYYPEREAVEGTASSPPSLSQNQGDATETYASAATHNSDIPETVSPPTPAGESHTEVNESTSDPEGVSEHAVDPGVPQVDPGERDPEIDDQSGDQTEEEAQAPQVRSRKESTSPRPSSRGRRQSTVPPRRKESSDRVWSVFEHSQKVTSRPGSRKRTADSDSVTASPNKRNQPPPR